MRSNSASRAMPAVTRIAGDTDAAVVDPPLPPLNGKLRVAELDLHLADLEAQRLGDDHRHDRARGRADVLRAAAHDHAAVRIDLALRARALAGAAPAVGGAARARA